MILIIFLFGLIIGSFLNAVIWRLHQGESFLRGRSYCPHCRHLLGIKDLIPLVSFIVQKGRCRYCGQSISWQYPLVEMATAFFFVLSFLRHSFTLMNQGWLFLNGESLFLLITRFFFISILIIIFVYDWRWSLILDKITLSALAIVLFINFLRGLPLENFFSAILIGGGFFLIQFLISKGRWIGGGDIRLGALMGAMLGWPQVLVALFLAYFIGAIVAVILIIFQKKSLSSPIPFGTFLSLATVVVLLYGQEILRWYLELIL